MSRPQEKLLAAEMLGALTLTFVAKAAGEVASGQFSVTGPPPHLVLGQTLLYSGLALVAMFGDQPARLAAGVGALVFLVILLRTVGPITAGLGLGNPPSASPALTGPPSQKVVA